MASVQVASKAYVDAIKTQVDAIATGQVSGVIGFDTLAALEADLAHDAGTVAYVTNDPTPANNGTYRKEGASGAGEWVQSSRGWSEADVAGLIGGSDVSPQTLVAWTEAEAYEPTSVTRNSNGVATSAVVKWPDGSEGAFTATTINDTWGTIDAYVITHADSGLSVTQTAVTRDPVTGAVTTKPALTVT